jgi:hypothetical protein
MSLNHNMTPISLSFYYSFTALNTESYDKPTKKYTNKLYKLQNLNFIRSVTFLGRGIISVLSSLIYSKVSVVLHLYNKTRMRESD